MLEDYPDILNVSQTANILQVCERTVYSLIRERKLGHIRIGSRIIIPKYCLIEYVNRSINRICCLEMNRQRKEIE